MSQLCLIKVLDYEAQQYRKKKKVLECEECILRDSCKAREKEENEKVNNT